MNLKINFQYFKFAALIKIVGDPTMKVLVQAVSVWQSLSSTCVCVYTLPTFHLDSKGKLHVCTTAIAINKSTLRLAMQP